MKLKAKDAFNPKIATTEWFQDLPTLMVYS